MNLLELYRRNPVLTSVGWFHWALAAVLLLLYFFDSRTILGINPWIKPAKFSISIAIYVWTLAWLLHYVSGKRAAGIISWGIAICMLSEIFAITLQSVRGVPSHFNAATPLDGGIFAAMGMMVGINTVLVVWILVLFFAAYPGLTAAYLWGIRFGLLIFLVASAEGVLMLIHGGHTVGAPDGGTGLPFVNWSRAHGDLRVMHFAGMHALQILPIAGYWLGRSRLPQAAQVSSVTAFFFLYLGVLALLLGMAWQGRSLLAR